MNFLNKNRKCDMMKCEGNYGTLSSLHMIAVLSGEGETELCHEVLTRFNRKKDAVLCPCTGTQYHYAQK